MAVLAISCTACATLSTQPIAISSPISQSIKASQSNAAINTADTQLPNGLKGKIIFILQQGSGKQRIASLIEASMDGKHAKVLTQVNGTIMSLSASRSGEQLIYTFQNSHSYPMIAIFNRTNHHIQVVSPPNTNNFSATMSPDGERLLLSSSLKGNPEIFLTDHQGKTLKQLTFHPAIDVAPVWSPDGNGFLFTSDREKFLNPQIFRYDFANQKIQRLTELGHNNAIARYSPDGSTITYVANNTQGMLMNLATRVSLPINDEGLSEPANFSPDGRYVIYSTKKQINIVKNPYFSKADLSPISKKYVITIKDIDLSDATIREPIWTVN